MSACGDGLRDGDGERCTHLGGRPGERSRAFGLDTETLVLSDTGTSERELDCLVLDSLSVSRAPIGALADDELALGTKTIPCGRLAGDLERLFRTSDLERRLTTLFGDLERLLGHGSWTGRA